MHVMSQASAADYEDARLSRVFNKRTPNRFPQAIVKAHDESCIIAAVKLAIEKHWRIAVRAGGHSFPVWSLHDDSLLIDLGDFKKLEIDQHNRKAKASPSIRSQDLNDVLIENYGLMFPGGHCPDVGLGGFLLQGGMGWNCRNWGWACEWVEAVEVVTVQGEPVFCNQHQNSDLYWAARGAGPAFPGVVTKFHLNLLPYPKNGFRSSGYIYPRSLYREAFSWVLMVTHDLDEDTEVIVISSHDKDSNEVCVSIFLVAMKATPEEAEASLRPIHATRPPGTLKEWCCEEDSLSSQYSKQAEANPQGNRYYTDNAYLHNQCNPVFVLEEAFLDLPHRRSFAFWSAMNPWSRRELPDMALSMRSDHYFAIYSVWEDESDDQRCQDWVRNVMQKIEYHSVGTYIGDSHLEKVNAGYWANANARRLIDVCAKWDPEGRMCRYQPNSAELEGRN